MDNELPELDDFSSPSVHEVSSKYRWLTVVLVVPLVALMLWAGYESIHNNLDDDGQIQPWVVALSILVFGGMSLVFLASLVWAFRTRIIIEGERMIVRSTFGTTIVTAERMQGFRWLNGQYYLYLKDRRFGIQIGYLDELWLIYRWIELRTTDLVAEYLEEEDAAIAADQSLGMTAEAREEQLRKLESIVSRIDWVAYLAAGVGVANFLFFENVQVEVIAFSALILVPLVLDMLAISNRGHVRVDRDEGSRYPEIFTATLVAGAVLAIVSLIDRGALLDTTVYYEAFGVGVLLKGLLWVYIDRDRLSGMLKRGKVVMAFTVLGMFFVPAFWVGGGLYQVNKLYDRSAVAWHLTTILDAKVKTSRTTSYSVELAPWSDVQTEAVEYTLRRKEFEMFETGMRVLVGVREGALNIAWASDLRPAGGGESAEQSNAGQ